MYFLLWPCFHGFIYPLISRCFSFLPLSTCQSCFMHFSAKCSTRDKVSASGWWTSCRKGRRLHARHRLVPAPMASLPYRRTGDRWSGTSGRPFDQKQPANGRPCRRHHGNQGKELPQDTRQPRWVRLPDQRLPTYLSTSFRLVIGANQRHYPGPCNRVKKTVHAALPPLRKKCRNFSPSLLMTVTRKTFFRPFSGITSIMPWKKFNTNFQQNQRSVKSYAYLRFKLHLFWLFILLINQKVLTK